MNTNPQGIQPNEDSPFARELFIQFLMKISVLHESDMEEIEEFRKAIGSEMQAYEHLGEYYEKLGDPDFKENARQTVDSYKVFLKQKTEEQQRNNNSGKGQNPIFDSANSQDKKQQPIPYGSVTSSQFGSPSQDSHQRSTKSSQMQQRPKDQQTGHTNGIHQRLFKEAVDKQEYSMLMDQLKHEQEVKECTFVPRINSHSREVSAQRGEKDPVFTRLAERKKMSLHSHANSWTIREDQELLKCTFKPQIHKLKSDSRVCQEQESVFDRLYGGNFLNSEIRKISHRLTGNHSNTKETKQFSATKVTTGHFSNSKIIPQDETIITPDKLKNKEDFLKWQNWNQSFENTNDSAPQTMSFSANRPSSNTNNEEENKAIHWSQQPIKQKDSKQQQKQQYQKQSKQESSRSLTPVKKSVSPLRSPQKSDKKDEDQTIFDRLYSLHFTRQNQQLVREIESNYQQQKELTFQPEKFTKSYKSINSNNSYQNDKDIYTRLYEVSQLQAMKLQGKLQQKEAQLLQQLEQAHPQLCKHSMELVQQGRMDNIKEVHERLFEQAMQKPKRNQVLLQKVQNDEGCTFKPLTNSNKYNSQNHSVLSKNGENEDPYYSNKSSNPNGNTPKNSLNSINIEQQVTPCRLELKPAPQPIAISKTPKGSTSLNKSPLNKSAVSSQPKTNDTMPFAVKKNVFFS